MDSTFQEVVLARRGLREVGELRGSWLSACSVQHKDMMVQQLGSLDFAVGSWGHLTIPRNRHTGVLTWRVPIPTGKPGSSDYLSTRDIRTFALSVPHPRPPKLWPIRASQFRTKAVWFEVFHIDNGSDPTGVDKCGAGVGAGGGSASAGKSRLLHTCHRMRAQSRMRLASVVGLWAGGACLVRGGSGIGHCECGRSFVAWVPSPPCAGVPALPGCGGVKVVDIKLHTARCGAGR